LPSKPSKLLLSRGGPFLIVQEFNCWVDCRKLYFGTIGTDNIDQDGLHSNLRAYKFNSRYSETYQNSGLATKKYRFL
jgi:hypothetical protein